ncbi:MAG TPA: hypothetical protein VGP33_16605 [Chloroflexota bacterium]|nr:hypothetical protein [Chloroflexota bacterium]
MLPYTTAIRPADAGDWWAVWPLLQAMGQVDSAAGARRRFQRVIADDRQYLPVALLAGQVADYAWAHQGPSHLRSGRSTVRLNDLFVAPEWRLPSPVPRFPDTVVPILPHAA